MAKIETIIAGIRRVTPAQEEGSAWESPNIYLVGEGPLTMIDAGYDKESSRSAILEGIGDAGLERIILTHGHVDHAGSAWAIKEMTGARVLAHPDDDHSIQRRFQGKTPDGHVNGGDRIECGSLSIEVLHAPGHTPGHIAPWLPSHGIIFTGDLVTGEGSSLVAPPEGNMKDYMQSLRSLLDLPLKMLLPGHGPVVNKPQKRIKELIEHREVRELAIAKCLSKKAMGLKELVQEMYEGLIHPQMEMAAAWTAWAHLEKMVQEGSVKAGPEHEHNPLEMRFQLAPGITLPF